ncbi:MAG: archaeal proteasome endopeptidase complex subunit beta [Candidatus Micrarchaeaceae archaeon]
MDAQLYEKIMKGTTTVGLVCSDGVVMGCDSRATMDFFIASTVARKIYKIDDNLAVTVAGSVGDAEELVRILKAQNELYKMNEGRSLSPKSAASLLSIILQENKMVPFYVQLIVGGLGEDGPQLHSLDPLGGVTEEPQFTSTGSGSLTALGYLEEVYKKGMQTKDAIKNVVKAISIAMKRDAATGNNILAATITKEGYKEYSGKDIEKFLA